MSNKNIDKLGNNIVTIKELIYCFKDINNREIDKIYCIFCKKELNTDDIYDVDMEKINFKCKKCGNEFTLVIYY